MLIPILLLISILIILDFIPIKFAININDAKANLNNEYFVCINESKIHIDIPWNATRQLNKHLENDLLIRVFGNSPYNILSSKDFKIVAWSEIRNLYFLNGKIERLEKEDKTLNLIADLKVNNWDIIYPIDRASFRKYYASKSYLTIYDFDWIKVIKSVWK